MLTVNHYPLKNYNQILNYYLAQKSKNLQYLKPDYLLLGENPGSKLTQAEKLGITQLSEAEFLTLVKK